MTERIDLDEFETDDSTDGDARPRGSWFWEGEGDPEDEVDPWTREAVDADAQAETADVDDEVDTDADPSPGPTDDGPAPAPRVPRTNDDRPVGIPMESGGSGGTSAGARPDSSPTDDGTGASPVTGTGATADATPDSESATDTDADADAGTGADADTGTEATPDGATATPSTAGATTDAGAAGATEPTGPHDGDADDMTLAFTYNAITRLSHLHGALADAEGWTDWIGVVGDVEAYVINKFQRDNHIDLDFFNGSGTGPGERLAEIDEHSMFYADRMVVVGVAGEDEPVAERAGWEFVPLEDAAAKAGWDVDS